MRPLLPLQNGNKPDRLALTPKDYARRGPQFLPTLAASPTSLCLFQVLNLTLMLQGEQTRIPKGEIAFDVGCSGFSIPAVPTPGSP